MGLTPQYDADGSAAPNFVNARYDLWSRKATVTGDLDEGSDRAFLYNHRDQIVSRYERDGDQVCRYVYAGDKPVGSFGQRMQAARAAPRPTTWCRTGTRCRVLPEGCSGIRASGI